MHGDGGRGGQREMTLTGEGRLSWRRYITNYTWLATYGVTVACRIL